MVLSSTELGGLDRRVVFRQLCSTQLSWGLLYSLKFCKSLQSWIELLLFAMSFACKCWSKNYRQCNLTLFVFTMGPWLWNITPQLTNDRDKKKEWNVMPYNEDISQTLWSRRRKIKSFLFSKSYYCHSLVLILILISIKTRIDNIFAKIFLTPKKAPKMVIHI